MASLVLSAEGDNPINWYPCDTYIRDIRKAFETVEGLAVDYRELAKGESEYDSELWNDADDPHFLTVSGIAPFRDVVKAMSNAGLIFEDCETLGTLGGPLSLGCVPDMPFGTESRLCVVSCRVTPFVEGSEEEPKPVTESTWNRVRAYFRHGDWY